MAWIGSTNSWKEKAADERERERERVKIMERKKKL
jgi:hypothetical protein